VRTPTRPVPRGHQNTNQFLLVTGDPLPVTPIRRGGGGGGAAWRWDRAACPPGYGTDYAHEVGRVRPAQWRSAVRSI